MKAAERHSFWYLILGGGLILLAGFLWAPRAGKEHRDELRRGADGGLDVLTKEAEEVRVGAGRWFARIAEYFTGDAAQRRGDIYEQPRRQE
jgi:hypothetical protein